MKWKVDDAFIQMQSCLSFYLISTCVLSLTSLYNSLQLCACMPACIIVSLHVPFFLHVCFILSLQLCETSCVCLLYLVYLLQESRLPAAALSLQIHSVRPPSSPGGPHVYLMIWLCVCVCVDVACMWCNLFHLFQALSDQLCVLTLPAFISQSTCSKAVTRHQLCQTENRLRNWDKHSLPICQRHVLV